MKTKILFSLVFTINVIFNCFSQEKAIKVTYVKGVKKITDESNNSPRILKGLTYTLYATNNKSRFSYNEKNNKEKNNIQFIGRGGGSDIYFKDLKNKTKLKQKTSKLNNEIYLIKDRKYNWVLTKEKKKIENYICYKAVAKYKKFSVFSNKEVEYKKIAWYTPEISFQFGPAGYDGLPGLVLALKSDGYYFIAQSIIFYNKIDENKLIKPTNGKLVTLDEYESIANKTFKKKYGKNIFKRSKIKN